MAVLKDTTVSGNIRVTDTVLADTVQANTIKVHASSDSETLSAGTDGQVLTTDGTNAYWGDATTYSNLAAASGGTDLSLVTTGEKYTWNNKTSNTGTVTSVTINATSPIAIDSNSAITTSGTRTVSHANSGVTAGTYRSVTVNATGHVTSGSNPTTLSGYGITDAENTGNKVTSISSSSTDDEYPSAKAVYNAIPDAVEANPTVPSGTTPTSLTGVKVGSSYYSIDGGVSDVTVGGSSVVNNNGVAVIPSIPDATGKADKVASATNGHLAGLDSNGNLTDSGMGIDNIPTANSNNVVKSGGIYDALATPKIAEKTYTDTFASSSSYSVHCFLKVLSNDWSKIHTIRFKVKAWIPNVSNSTAISDVTLQIYQGVVKSYYIKNAIANTDYRPYYSLYYYGTTSTGFNNNVPELIGIYINSANTYSYTTKRNYIVQVINADGCTFEFFDNDCNVSTAKGDYNSSTYYLSAATYNTYTNGLQETSDTNTTYSVISNDELRTGTATSSRTVSAARLAANYNISTDSTTGVSTIRIGANTISPEVVSNKVTSLSSSSTDTEYPSAKCVYDELQELSETINAEPFDARSEYLTIEALENSTEVYFGLRHNRGSVKTIYISTDKETWTSKTSSLMSTGNHGTLLATLSKGQKLYLRGDNNGYGNYYTEDGDTMYTGNTIYVSKYNFIYGNLFSLINSTNFSTMTQLSYGTCAFTCLFYGNTYLLSHPYKRLVIPLTGAYSTEAIFQYMFTNCRNLSVGPEFGYASAKSAVQGMFGGCYKLKYIKYTCNNGWGFDNSYFGEDNIKYCVYEDSIDLSKLPSAQVYIKASEEPKNLASVIAIQAINELRCEPDWNVANEYRPGYIKNKPTIPAAQIQSDWNQTTSTALDYIKNKPQLNWPEYDAKNNYLTFEALYDNTIVYFGTTKYSSDTELPSEHQKTIEVSKDGVTWTQVTSSLREFALWNRTITINDSKGAIAATLNANEKLYVRGDNNFYFEDGGLYDKYSTGFLFSAPCFVYGNIMSLCSSTSFSNLTTLSANYTFRELFANNYYTLLAHPYKKLVLPATSLSTYCYRDMFLSCYSLTVAPEFPENVTIEYGVFGDCRNLKYLNATFATYVFQIATLFDYYVMGHYQSTVPSCIVIVNIDDWSRSTHDESAVDRCIFIDSDKEPDGLRNYIACETFYNKNDTCYNEEVTSLIRPNIVVDFGTLSNNLSRATFLFCEIGDKFIANNYYWVFNTPSRNYTIVWPAEITSWYGGEGAPVIRANKHYEISVLNGVGMWIETDIPT